MESETITRESQLTKCEKQDILNIICSAINGSLSQVPKYTINLGLGYPKFKLSDNINYVSLILKFSYTFYFLLQKEELIENMFKLWKLTSEYCSFTSDLIPEYTKDVCNDKELLGLCKLSLRYVKREIKKGVIINEVIQKYIDFE